MACHDGHYISVWTVPGRQSLLQVKLLDMSSCKTF